jgi:opacity protein-like surface antigen
MTAKKFLPLVLTLFALALPVAVLAQDDGWSHTVTPYLMAAHMDGTSAVGQLDVDVNLSASDIFSNLDFGAMLAYRGETEDWAVMTDFIYMKLGASKTSESDKLYGRMNLEQTIIQLDLARRLTDHFEITLGTRYWDVTNALLLRGQGPIGSEIRAEAGESWFDPLVGFRFSHPISDSWVFLGKGDIGGFGIGSDFTWHASVGASWLISDSMAMSLLYRYIDVDYESGSGPSYFALDVAESGPGMGFSFRF